VGDIPLVGGGGVGWGGGHVWAKYLRRVELIISGK